MYATLGCSDDRNNSTRVFFRFMASEKMSNRSKIGSLEASRRLLEVRPLKKYDPKMIKNHQNQSKTKGEKSSFYLTECRIRSQKVTRFKNLLSTRTRRRSVTQHAHEAPECHTARARGAGVSPSTRARWVAEGASRSLVLAQTYSNTSPRHG